MLQYSQIILSHLGPRSLVSNVQILLYILPNSWVSLVLETWALLQTHPNPHYSEVSRTRVHRMSRTHEFSSFKIFNNSIGHN